MPWVAAVGAVAGAAISSDASRSAANKQADANKNAAQLQKDMFEQSFNAYAPYRQAGQSALSQLSSFGSDNGLPVQGPDGTTWSVGPGFMHQFNANDLQSNLAPNYQFMLGQGQAATQNLANMGGGLLSGNSLKAINDYTQNYASNAYQQAFSNYTSNQTNIFNRLSNIAGLGQTANQVMTGAGVQTGQNIGGFMTGAAQAQAAGTVGQANAWSQGLGTAGTWYGLSNIGKSKPSGYTGYAGGYGSDDYQSPFDVGNES